MHAIRDNVYDKLSSFFSDSQTPNDALDQEPEASSHATDNKSPSSMLSFLPSASFSWYRRNEHANDATSGSQSFKWRSKSFSLKDKPLDRTESYDDLQKENAGYQKVNGGHSSTRRQNHNHDSFGSNVENSIPRSGGSTSSGSDTFEDVFTPHSFEKSVPSFLEESVFISPDLYNFFEASLPNIVKDCQWAMLYSTARDGISLNTLFRKSAGFPGPFLLITGDKQGGAVFGGLLDCPLKVTAKRKYQGSSQSFVFTTIYGDPRLFRATGANRYFYLCLNDLLAFGGGANFALCLNEDLLSGSSGPCETFGNSCLAHDQEFALKDIELWGFAHASQYVT